MGVRYDKVVKSSAALAEGNDCSVRALALVLNVRYETALLALESAGRRPKDGAHMSQIITAARGLGFQIRRQYSARRLALEGGFRRTPKTADAEDWAHLPPLLLHLDGHVAALVDGKVEDWTAGKEAPILDAYEFWRPSEKVALGVEPPPVVYL